MKLLGLLADRIHLSTSSFINIRYRLQQPSAVWNFTLPLEIMGVCVSSVVGPALTFRIRQNEHNMTAAEVAAKAGEAGKRTSTNLPTVAKRRECLRCLLIRPIMPHQMCVCVCFFSPTL